MPDWSVPVEWPHQTAVCIASGPSLTREQCETVRGRARVIAINNQGVDNDVDGKLVPAFAPWADVLYAADAKWWECHATRARLFAGRKVTVRPTKAIPNLLTLQQSSERAFDPRPTHLVTGGNSGYQAIHLAVHLGATRIVLLGYDMQETGRRRHWFGNHPGHLNCRSNFGGWLRSFERLAVVLADMGIEVINCTPTTALRSFRLASIREVFG